MEFWIYCSLDIIKPYGKQSDFLKIGNGDGVIRRDLFKKLFFILAHQTEKEKS